MILKRIVEDLTSKARGLELADIRIGLEYVGVELSDGTLGVSYLFKEEVGHCCSRDFADEGFIGRPATDLVEWSLHMKDTLLSSIGIASLNALSAPQTIPSMTKNDAVDEIGFKKTDVVGMIGNFRPMVPGIVEKVKELKIFERKPGVGNPLIYPDWAAYSILPSCDIVIISGTTNINKTQDILLSCCSSAREVAVIGPSTIVYPPAYADTSATLLAGAYADPIKKDDIFTVISQGGGGFRLLKYLTKYAVRLGKGEK